MSSTRRASSSRSLAPSSIPGHKRYQRTPSYERHWVAAVCLAVRWVAAVCLAARWVAAV